MKIKFICFFALLCFFVSFTNAHARDFGRRGTNGEVVFTDAIYGAAIGALVGVALVAIDDSDSGSKIGAGVLVGTLLGVAYGLHETKSFAEYRDGTLAFNIPNVTIKKDRDKVVYNLPIFRAEFK